MFFGEWFLLFDGWRLVIFPAAQSCGSNGAASHRAARRTCVAAALIELPLRLFFALFTETPPIKESLDAGNIF